MSRRDIDGTHTCRMRVLRVLDDPPGIAHAPEVRLGAA